jgi:membrane protease YdiL (CAAX protease family)
LRLFISVGFCAIHFIKSANCKENLKKTLRFEKKLLKMNSQQSNVTPGVGLVLLVLLALIGSVFFMVIGGLVSMLLTESSSISEALSADYTNLDGLNSIRILQSFQTLGLFIFPAVLFAFIHTKQPFTFLGFNRVSLRFLLLSVAFMFIALPGINFLASLNALIPMPQWAIDLELKALEITEALLTTKSFTIFLSNIFVVAVLPALGEELFFRGVMQPFVIKLLRNSVGFLQSFFTKLLNKSFWGILKPLITKLLQNSFWTVYHSFSSKLLQNPFLGIFITAFVFSAIHFQFQGFIPRLALGMMFGYLYLWSGSLWVPIAVHFVNNASATIVFYLIGNGKLPAHTENIGELNQLWAVGLTSIIFAGVLGYLLWTEKSKKLNAVVGQPANE